MNFAGIQFRLLLLAIVPTLLLISSLAYYFIQYHYIDLENALKDKGQITINQLAISSIYGVFSGNSEVLNEIASSLLNEPDIALVEITDKLGNALAHSEKNPFPPQKKLIFFQHPVAIQSIQHRTNETANTLLHQPISKPAKIIGSVKIALSLVNTQKKQQSYLLNSLLLICIGVFFTILLSIRLSNSISTPIINLIKIANDLADGNMNARAKGSSTSEIDDLCLSFNSMAIALQNTHNYLTQQVELAVNKLNVTLGRLEQKNKSLEKTTQLAITQNNTKSQFLAHISHEIRTPMNGILGFIELLTKSKLSLQQLDQAHLIKTSATSLLAIVNEILDYSSLETGNFKINISTFNFRENLENCSTTIVPASDKVCVIVDIDENIPYWISTDPIRLQQVITNLLGNACKFTHQGHIIIRCHLLESNSLFISISDTGIGIHKNKIKDLFLPFLQTSEYAVNNELGTGLGLTISKNIIERLGGTLGVCTQYNTGTTFWFNLPISITKSPPVKIQTLRILIIDALNLRRKALTKQLNHLGYKTLTSSSITELKLKPSSYFDLLFYADKNETYDVNEIQNQIKPVTCSAIIFLNSHKKTLSFVHCLALPCRSNYLKNVIETITHTTQAIPDIIPNKTSIRATSCSIFIADDNEINRLLLKSQLEEHCKNITLAKDGKKALFYLQQHKYDLIFLDLQMPYFSGQDIIKNIKKTASINRDSPVIAITAHAQSHQRQTLIEAGFDECLIKPVLLEQLTEILNLWLPEKESCLQNKTEMMDYVKAMLDKTSGNIDLATTLFNKLFIELQQQSETIERALNSNNLTLAEQVTHKLHGSVSFCGFVDIQEMAAVMEVCLIEKNTQCIDTNFLVLKNKIIDFIKLKETILNQLT